MCVCVDSQFSIAVIPNRIGPPDNWRRIQNWSRLLPFYFYIWSCLWLLFKCSNCSNYSQYSTHYTRLFSTKKRYEYDHGMADGEFIVCSDRRIVCCRFVMRILVRRLNCSGSDNVGCAWLPKTGLSHSIFHCLSIKIYIFLRQPADGECGRVLRLRMAIANNKRTLVWAASANRIFNQSNAFFFFVWILFVPSHLSLFDCCWNVHCTSIE